MAGETERKSGLRIILVRHGETVHNRGKIFGGRIDSPLTELGRMQANETGKFLGRTENLDEIYASPLSRARETADEIARLQGKRPKVKVVRSLVERHSGSFQGRKHSEISGRVWEEFRKHPADVNEKVGGRESLLETKRRLEGFSREILAKDKKTVCIVSHGGVTSVLVSLFTEIPLSHIKPLKIDNCSVTEILVRKDIGRSYIERMNSTSHLPEGFIEKKRQGREEVRLVLVRHGETNSNIKRLIQGKTETPLSSGGKRQALEVARALSGRTLDAIFTSPLSRARETAEEIARFQKKKRGGPIVEPLLVERDFGKFEGKPLSDWIGWSKKRGEDYLEKSHGGESQRQVEERALSFLRKRIPRYEGKTVCIVSHGNFLKTLVCAVLGIKPTVGRAFFPGNCKISELSISRGRMPRIVYFNEDVHLRRSEQSPWKGRI